VEFHEFLEFLHKKPATAAMIFQKILPLPRRHSDSGSGSAAMDLSASPKGEQTDFVIS
jgi:hypothetical protein